MASLPNSGLKAYGLCELVTKSKQTYPVTVSAIDRTRINAEIQDKFDGIFYHRFLNSTGSEDVNFSFGIDLSDRISARLRTFIAYKVRLGENFIFDFIRAIPKTISLDGFKLIQRGQNIDLIADHEGVYNQEYSQSQYEHHRVTYNIYAIEYNIEFITC